MKWISVKDRLPTKDDADENGKVLVYRFNNTSQVSLNKSIYDWKMCKYLHESSFWMPLPEPPKV